MTRTKLDRAVEGDHPDMRAPDGSGRENPSESKSLASGALVSALLLSVGARGGKLGYAREGEIARWAEILATGPISDPFTFPFLFLISFLSSLFPNLNFEFKLKFNLVLH